MNNPRHRDVTDRRSAPLPARQPSISPDYRNVSWRFNPSVRPISSGLDRNDGSDGWKAVNQLKRLVPFLSSPGVGSGEDVATRDHRSNGLRAPAARPAKDADWVWNALLACQFGAVDPVIAVRELTSAHRE